MDSFFFFSQRKKEVGVLSKAHTWVISIPNPVIITAAITHCFFVIGPTVIQILAGWILLYGESLRFFGWSSCSYFKLLSNWHHWKYTVAGNSSCFHCAYNVKEWWFSVLIRPTFFLKQIYGWYQYWFMSGCSDLTDLWLKKKSTTQFHLMQCPCLTIRPLGRLLALSLGFIPWNDHVYSCICNSNTSLCLLRMTNSLVL